MQQKDGRYRSASAQAAIREQVIDYLKKQLGTQSQAAEIFGLHIRSVNRMWAKYKSGGSRNIKEKKRGVQGGKKINGKQSAEVRQLIKDKLPDNSEVSAFSTKALPNDPVPPVTSTDLPSSTLVVAC